MSDQTSHQKQSAFVWYHASLTDKADIKAWLKVVKDHFEVDARLYIRTNPEEITFMECYDNITSARSIEIETLA
ncbi:MAG: hypothetical protein R8K22_06530, partial [Mariprofundaceae bacterium]